VTEHWSQRDIFGFKRDKTEAERDSVTASRAHAVRESVTCHAVPPVTERDNEQTATAGPEGRPSRSGKGMRDTMPTVAAWIDELRQAFGTENVDAWIRVGLKQGGFYAEEGGASVGTPMDWSGYRVAACVPEPVKQERKR
jgi:hypothetical protein